MALQRLDKLISAATTLSRKDVKALVKTGRITVDGKRVSSADEKYDHLAAEIRVDGKIISYKKNHYFMLNKPAGFLSATEDGRDRTVLDLLKENDRAFDLFPAGRLDKDSEGLLILTDDGEYCHNIISPKKYVYKTYYVEVEAPLEESDCNAFEKGIVLGDGMVCLPGKLEITGEKTGLVTIREGKYHQVKRMLGSLGKKVNYLKRLSIGGLVLDNSLAKGEYREMTETEVQKVFE